MYSVGFPSHNYDQVLDVLSKTKTNSVKTSSLPLADFWHPQRNTSIRKILLKKLGICILDDKTDDYCFEYPTPAYKNRKYGATIKYSQPSMTDLMIRLSNGVRVTIEAKYTEYVKDEIYKPLLSKWIENKSHRKDIAQCWLDYMGSNSYCDIKKLDSLLDAKNFPYQFLHRAASACFDCNNPILVYQLFFDQKNNGKMKKFEKCLKEYADILQLNSNRFPFYIVECEVILYPKNWMADASKIFTDMKKEVQYDFSNEIKVLNGYTLDEI